MSEPTSPSDATPPVPPAPTAAVPPPPVAPPAAYTYGQPVAPPAPAYGEQVPGYAVPAYGTPVAGPRRRTWDVVLTIVLFVLGLIGMIIGVSYGVIFLMPELLLVGLEQQGYGLPTIDSRGPGTVIIVSHVLLYLVAVGVGILLLVKKRVAFYVPLAAGVIAAIVFWVVAAQVFLSIPGFAA